MQLWAERACENVQERFKHKSITRLQPRLPSAFDQMDQRPPLFCMKDF